jgi:ribosomal protein S9
MATVEKMTIHKALCELKILDSRINNAISSARFCLANKHSNEKVNGVTVEEYQETMKASYNKASDLIRRREAIKRAVVLSNAKTIVKIGGKEYTVAEAIEMNNHGIDLKLQLKNAMKKQYDSAMTTIISKNSVVDDKATEYVVGLFGQKESKTANEEYEKARKSYIEANTMELIDPVNILEKIEALEVEIADFTTEVDSALSVSNALTEITVEY